MQAKIGEKVTCVIEGVLVGYDAIWNQAQIKTPSGDMVRVPPESVTIRLDTDEDAHA